MQDLFPAAAICVVSFSPSDAIMDFAVGPTTKSLIKARHYAQLPQGRWKHPEVEQWVDFWFCSTPKVFFRWG